MLKRIWSLAIKEFLHLRHNWWLPALMIIGGAVELLAVGWATARPITNLPLLILDQDRSVASRAIIENLEDSDTFTLSSYATTVAEIEDAFRQGTVSAALMIPQGFESRLVAAGAERSERPSLDFWVDGSESIAGETAVREARGIIQQYGQETVLGGMGLDGAALEGFEPTLTVRFNEDLSAALYTTPAELALIMEWTVLLFAALAFSRERELGTLEQLLVMPFSSLELIIGKSIPAVVIGIADFWLLLAVIHFAFGVPVRGSLLLLFFLALGYVLVELGKGLIISLFSRTQHQAFLLVLLVGMIDFMFTGYAAPVESMPRILQGVARLIPAYHWLSILRNLLLKGAGLDVLWVHVGALAGLGLVIGFVALLYVRRVLD
jgi:ABC-2 type transport system permease protein